MMWLYAKFRSDNIKCLQILIFTTIFTFLLSCNAVCAACTENEWDCDDGQCIDRDSLCDGVVNCNDGSDETPESCMQVEPMVHCPEDFFMCRETGECVDNYLTCDGHLDCDDGSDETVELCSTTTTTTPTPTTPSPPITMNACKLSNDPNMIVVDFLNIPLKSGAMVAANIIVKFSCRRGFTLIGNTQNYCKGNQWNLPLPKCQKFCDLTELTKGWSTFVTCERDSGKVQCTDTVPPRTTARIGCATSFTAQSDATLRLSCQENGEWNYKRSKCKMVCGKVAPPTTQFARGGGPTSIFEVPWHVGIYSNFDVDYKHICGGTIISPSLVISAAHCFWNEAFSKLFEEKYYRVVAGKYYRDYAKEKDLYQSSDVKNIYLEFPYSDRSGSYRNDIAVLVLKTHFQFSASVSPACVRFQKNSFKEVETNIFGKFAGWGITENHTEAEELQSVVMTALSNVDCRKRLKQYGNYDLPDDKFCLFDDEYGKSACRGDSGGGFVLSESNNGMVTHYLIGIISHAPAKDQDCAIDGVVALTNINYFERLIEPLMDEETNSF